MILTPEQINEFEEAAEPLIKWLNKFHPHVRVIVDGGSAEFVEDVARILNAKYIKD